MYSESRNPDSPFLTPRLRILLNSSRNVVATQRRHCDIQEEISKMSIAPRNMIAKGSSTMILNYSQMSHKGEEEDIKQAFSKVVLSAKKYRANKYNTFVTGLSNDFDINRIAKHLGRLLNCTSAVDKKKDSKDKHLIRLTGDQRQGVREFLLKHQLCNDDQIVISG